MDAVFRAVFIYIFLYFFTIVSGKRFLAELTVFDFLLVIIIGSATGQALVTDDFSITNSAILILSLIFIDIIISLFQTSSPRFDKLTNGAPVILVDHGHIHSERIKKSRVGIDEILASGRKLRGLERLDQIKYAVLERDGTVSIIPMENVDSFLK